MESVSPSNDSSNEFYINRNVNVFKHLQANVTADNASCLIVVSKQIADEDVVIL